MLTLQILSLGTVLSTIFILFVPGVLSEGKKYNIGWKKVYFFAVFLCLPASPRPITMVLASHSTSTFRPIVFLDVAMSESGRIDRLTEHGGASVARLKFPQYGVHRVHSLGFDPLRSIEPETFHMTVA